MIGIQALARIIEEEEKAKEKKIRGSQDALGDGRRRTFRETANDPNAKTALVRAGRIIPQVLQI